MNNDATGRPQTKTVYEILDRDAVHPFPARMAPGIALEAIAEETKPLRILDPMAGSGTVLAVARSRGHSAVGVDIDPLAILITKVWTMAIDTDHTRKNAAEVLARARNAFQSLHVRDAYPRNADSETKHFVRYWFDDYARRQLASLAKAIHRVQDEATRNALWCAFSRLIITKQSGASLAMDLSHSRPHKVFDRAPTKPFRKFLHAADRVLDNCIDKRQSGRGPATRVYEGDARSLPLADESIDLVLTSPPYLNAIDYFRCSKFSLVWMGHTIANLRLLRSTSVGTEIGADFAGDEDIRKVLTDLKLRPKLATREEAVLARYIDDMRSAIREVARVLTPAGRAVYVVGENTIRGTYIRNSFIVSTVAELSGLECTGRRSRLLPANRRYLPPPSKRDGKGALDGRMRREIILTFRKAT